MRPGKVIVDWSEFETRLKAAKLNEQEFTRELQLGMYTLREWKRTRNAPYWAVKYLEVRMGNGPAAIQPNISLIVAQLTPDEYLVWDTAITEGNKEKEQEMIDLAIPRAIKIYGDIF